MTKTDKMDNLAAALFSSPNLTEDEPFGKTVTVEFDSSDELSESSACYVPNLRPRPAIKPTASVADVTTDPKIHPSPPERAVSSTDSPPTKKIKTDEFATCVYCNYSPCILDQGLYEVLSEGGLLRGDDNDIHSIRKQIRYDMYRQASRFIYGILRKGNRKQLPHCVVAEIHDFAPEDVKENYVGFQETAGSP